MIFSSPIRRRRDGRYAIRLDPGVRAVLRSASEQMVPMLVNDDDTTRRLFPPAYIGTGQEAHEREYRQLVDAALVNHRRDALTVLSETAGSDTISGEQLDGWLSAIGSMRLVLGTRLDVGEDGSLPDEDDPSAPEHALYLLLGVLQEAIVSVLAADLPYEGDPERGL